MRLLKEPLLHFVMLGGLMFAGYSAFGTAHQEAQPQPVIRMTAADAEWLKTMWTRQWRRPPTDEELTGLVADHLREEVLAREAKALELDIGDTIVRRRLAQKMSFLLDDPIRTTEPLNPSCAPSTGHVRTSSTRQHECPSRRSSSAARMGMDALEPASWPCPMLL